MRGLVGSLAVVIALIGGGIGVASVIYWNVIMVGYTGHPLDYAGASPPCPHCGHVYTRGDGWHSYQCDRCHIAFRCRSDERNHFVYDAD